MTASDFRLIPPPFTPLHADGSLNLAIVEQQAKLLIGDGVDGVFVAGSTGEGQSLTNAERKSLLEAWLSAAGSELAVIAQVGHNAQGDAIELADHAQQAGADAVAALAPCYFKPQDVDALIDFLAPVAAAAGDLPFYFYDIPGMTGVKLPMAEFLTRAKERIPNLAGLKFSHADLASLQQCVQLNEGEFDVLFGCDEFLLAGCVLGAHGAVGTTYNFVAGHYRAMLVALHEGRLADARLRQAEAAALITATAGFGLAGFKTLMMLRGVDCGPVRTPLRRMTPEQQAALLRLVDNSPCWHLGRPAARRTAAQIS